MHDQISTLDDIQTELELNEQDLTMAAKELNLRLRHHGIRGHRLAMPDFDELSCNSIGSISDLNMQL